MGSVDVDGELPLGKIGVKGRTDSEDFCVEADVLRCSSMPEEKVRSDRSGGDDDLLLRISGDRVELCSRPLSVNCGGPDIDLDDIPRSQGLSLLDQRWSRTITLHKRARWCARW